MSTISLPSELQHSVKIVASIVARPDISVTSIIEKGQKRILKQYDCLAVCMREKEAMTFLAKKLSIIPTIHASNKRWIIMDFIEGINMKAFAKGIDAHLLFDFGALLGQLHAAYSIQELNNETFWHRQNYTTCDQDSWIEYLKTTLQKWMSRIKIDTDSEHLLQTVYQYLVTRIDDIHKHIDLAVLHSDYQFRNIIIKKENAKWQIKACIDFEHILIGEVHFDLAKPFLTDFNALGALEKERFLEGWHSASKIALDRNKLHFYILVHAIAALAWVDKQPHPTKAQQQFRAAAMAKLRAYIVAESQGFWVV